MRLGLIEQRQKLLRLHGVYICSSISFGSTITFEVKLHFDKNRCHCFNIFVYFRWEEMDAHNFQPNTNKKVSSASMSAIS